MYEIEAKARSYSINVIITERGSRRYASAIGLITLVLVIAIVLLMANKFVTIEKMPMDVEVVTLLKIHNNPKH